MSVKSIKKQLAAAIAMVLVAAIALGSSTYAWFASNSKVTANGMQISAATEGSQLIIADTIDNLYTGDKANKTSVGLNLSGANLHPVHPVYTEIGTSIVTQSETWNHAYSDTYNVAISGSNEVALDKNQLSVDSNVGKVGTDGYYLTGTIAVGLAVNGNAKVTDLKVDTCSISWADGTQDTQKTQLLKTVRVMLTEATTNKVVGIYGNGNVVTSVGNAQSGTFGQDGFTAAVADSMGNLVVSTGDTNTSPVIAAEISQASTVDDAKNNAKLFNVYIYFDGRDENCTTEQYSAANLNVVLNFVATPA